MPSVTVAVYAALSVTAMGLIMAPIEGLQPVSLIQPFWLLGAGSALIVGYLFVLTVMRVGDIGFVAPFRYTALIWAIALGWVIFGALPDALTLTGGGIVIATGIYTLYREGRVGQRVATPPRASLRIR